MNEPDAVLRGHREPPLILCFCNTKCQSIGPCANRDRRNPPVVEKPRDACSHLQLLAAQPSMTALAVPAEIACVDYAPAMRS